MKSPDDYFLLDPATIEAPFEFWQSLRLNAPVYEVEGIGFYLVSRYEDVQHVLRNHEVFSNDYSAHFGVGMSMLSANEKVNEILADGYPETDALLFADPPDHTRHRSLVDSAFRPRRVAQLETVIRGIADDLTGDLLAGLAPGESRTVDFVTAFAAPVPIRVIASAVGIENADAGKVKEWSDAVRDRLGGELDEAEDLVAAGKTVEMQHYLAALIDEVRERPADTLLSDLVHATAGDAEPLTKVELLSILKQILTAGNETTRNVITSAMYYLGHNPDVLARVRADHSLIPAMVEETIRLTTPVNAFFRVTKQDVELGGVTIPEQALVLVLFGSANRDEEHFPDADRFDIDRPNLRHHMGFGFGVHYCVGAALGRTQARIAFETLFSRAGDIALAPGAAPVQAPNFMVRGLLDLPVVVSAP